MADALGLGPSGAIHGGSSPFSRTNSSVGIVLTDEADRSFLPARSPITNV